MIMKYSGPYYRLSLGRASTQGSSAFRREDLLFVPCGVAIGTRGIKSMLDLGSRAYEGTLTPYIPPYLQYRHTSTYPFHAPRYPEFLVPQELGPRLGTKGATAHTFRALMVAGLFIVLVAARLQN